MLGGDGISVPELEATASQVCPYDPFFQLWITGITLETLGAAGSEKRERKL